MAESLWSNCTVFTKAHYLLKQETVLLDCLWNEAPAFYFQVEIMSDPTPKAYCFLGMVTPSDTAEFYGKLKVQLESTLIADRE